MEQALVDLQVHCYLMDEAVSEEESIFSLKDAVIIRGNPFPKRQMTSLGIVPDHLAMSSAEV